MLYQGPYLRVITPRTADGNRPLIGDDGKQETKESHLPLTAKKHLEEVNKNLPKHLQHKIELVEA